MASNFRNEYLGSEMAEDAIQIKTAEVKISGSLCILGDSKVNIFEKPHQLIYTDEEGLLQINADVFSELSKVNKEINVVGVCGLYRSGKSYLMNWIAGEKAGFDLGDTIQSKTKGIWVWCRQHPTQSDQVLVLLDTEGLDDPEKGDPDHDSNMFCLTLLMSSTFIINVKNVFDFSTLDKLAFIASLSDTIKVLDDEAEDEHNAKAIPVASPTLIMCIRDFFLKNTKDGKDQTPTEYLEDNLKSVDMSTVKTTKQKERQRKFNTIKECIKDYFPKRKCFTIALPASGDDLQKIEKLDETSLEKRFVENIKALQKYVYDRKPKYICNASKKPLDGADLASLIKFYVDSLRNGSPLRCQDAYGQTSFEHNERVLNMVTTKFKKDMDKLRHIENKEKLQTMFLPLFDKACSKYREDSFVYNQDEYEDKLMAKMQDYLDMMKKKISKTCMENGTKELAKMYDEMQTENRKKTDKTTSNSNYTVCMEKLKQDFFEAKKQYDKDVLFECFDKFMKSKNDETMALYRDATGQKYKDQYDESHNEINKRMEDQLKRILDGEHKRRNRYLEEELAVLRAGYVELSKSLNQRRLCSIM